jgi:ribosomal protein S18 acetylase RimI-like enzyme
MDFTIEELSMDAWPSIQTLLYDGWVIRMANGYSNRSNSINPIYPSKIKLEDKMEYCDKIFSRYNLPTTYKIIECDEHKTIDKELEQRKYKIINTTSLQICSDFEVLQNNYDGITVNDFFNTPWINSVVEFNTIKQEHITTFKTILSNIVGEKIVVHKEAKNEIVGCGHGVIGNNYVGIFDIVVKENQRGKGYGKEIIKTILSEAGKKGIKNAYLQVMMNNALARELYKKLGYKEIYKYWYRKKEGK